MRFSKYLWDQYLASSEGQQWVEFFGRLPKMYKQKAPELKKFLADWGQENMLQDPASVDADIDAAFGVITGFDTGVKSKEIPKGPLKAWRDAVAVFTTLERLRVPQEGSRALTPLFDATDIPRLSVGLYCLYPEFFFPYYFWPRFYALQEIFREFGIHQPPVPPKRDFKGRFRYYLSLCEFLHDFCRQYGIAGEHLPVFLYGFARSVMGPEKQAVTQLPAPKRAWFVGAGIGNNGDFEYLDDATADARTFWQGNEETELGDIIVVYCLTPRSCVHSIWRAIKPGAVEPFRIFYNTIWIGHPSKVAPISIQEIKSDPVLCNMPLVRGNMQGINGRQTLERVL